MVKKDFFKRRTEAQIKKLDCKVVDTPEGLVDAIEELDIDREGLILDFPLVHPDFNNPRYNPQYNSRRTGRGAKFKGSSGSERKSFPAFLCLDQPISREGAKEGKRRPFIIRNDAFRSMKQLQEEDNFQMGYLYRSITGNVRIPHLISFWAIDHGNMLDSFSERMKVNLPNFDVGAKVERNYAPNIYLKVPSKQKGKGRYTQLWRNVPTEENDSRRVLAWNTSNTYGSVVDNSFQEDVSAGPGYKNYQIGQENPRGEAASLQFRFVDDHDVEGYSEMIRYFMRRGNLVPLEMSQIAIPSREDIPFARKLDNNLLIRTVNKSGESFNHPREDQYSILRGRHIAKHIRSEEEARKQTSVVEPTMYWDPERDGRIRDYPWRPGEK
jgi:hypothetical protein